MSPFDANVLPLGEVLKQIREAKGLKQEDVAHDARITTGTLSRTETGETSPSWSTVQRIADALGTRLVDIAAAIEGIEL